MRKCPKGVICIENFTLFFLIIIFLLLVLIFRYFVIEKEKTSLKQDKSISNVNSELLIKTKGPYSSLLLQDPLINPYNPPLRNENYISGLYNRNAVNIPTNIGYIDSDFRQVGILNALNTKGKILPLMGRPLFSNRDKWQYYTISNQNNFIKLPISRNGKSCMNEYGVNKLYNGDSIFIEGINEPYIITLYDNDTIRYMPVL
jgi:hypothetical protein